MRITVLHQSYGCESGCCGHVIEVDGERAGGFHFDHPGHNQSYLEFARELVTRDFGEDHVKDLDWENCLVSEF